MQKQKKRCNATTAQIESYATHLQEQEKSTATIQKYVYNLTAFFLWLDGRELTKIALIEWKGYLTEQYAPASVNSMLATVNGFLSYLDLQSLSVKPLKIQKALFSDGTKELTREEYYRLVRAAEQDGNQRLALLIQTICAIGIRVSELKFITVEAVHTGRAEVSNKGKRRMVFLPGKLCSMLKRYLKHHGITTGPVFVTRSGTPLNRSNIWRDMKALCESSGVEPGKVFPHNLRHLFARTYYAVEKDLSRLADILGHSNVATTRIYTMESGVTHARQLEHLGLIFT